MREKEQGFTLVELSIVLVIVGLLIGGILVGQSLIESAKITVLIKEIGQYEIAFAQFKSKYKYYPGDAPARIFPGSYSGATVLGDGKLGHWHDAIGIWYQLNAGMALSLESMNIARSTYSLTYGTVRPGINVPELNFRKQITFSYSGSDFKLIIVESDANTTYDASMTGVEAFQLDVKTDDGLRSSGNYVGSTCGGCNWGPLSPSFPFYHCHSSPTIGGSGYSSNADARCNMGISFDRLIAQ